MKCSICNSEDMKSYLQLYDDRFGFPGTFSILSCGNCRHKLLDASFSSEEIGRLYTEYYPRSQFPLDEYKPYAEQSRIKAWLDGSKSFAFRWVPSGVRILDIGCGFGETLGYHKSRDCDVYGVEADENIRRVAEKFGYNVHIGLFDPYIYEPDFFDYVTMDQVIEHVADPMHVLRDIATVLKPGGYAILGTPNTNGWGAFLFGKRWISWHVPYHVQYFSRRSMEIAAEKSGFTVECALTITFSDYLHSQWNHLITRPTEGHKSVYWSPDVLRLRREKFILKALYLLHLTRINHLLTRAFDFLGLGDNYLFVLRKR